MNKYDAVIIGSGPGGQKAALASAKLGKRVALVENWELGGSSLHYGTIPSKTLREAILDLTNFKQRSFYAKNNPLLDKESISITDLSYRVGWVKDHLQKHLRKQLEKNHITIILGKAHFIDAHTMEIERKDGTTTKIWGDKYFIATGSKPRLPKGIIFDHKNILTSSDILHMDVIPKSLIVIGAGVIGCEYASMMSILGVRVTLVDKNKRMLSFLDKEICAHLQIAMEEHGLLFIREKEYVDIKQENGVSTVTFSDGSHASAEKVLVAAGRSANVETLHLDKTGVTLNHKGYIEASKSFQTAQENIYAVGDVIGGPSLSSTSYIQGVFAANCAFSNQSCKPMNIYPIGIYTIPEISNIGETEESLIEKKIPYEVGRAYFYEISKCTITGNKSGLCKLLFCPKKFTLLGAHIVGRGATEVIHIAQLAISLKSKIHYFVDHVFNFPTYAEMYAIAAQNGLNKVIQKGIQKNEENKV